MYFFYTVVQPLAANSAGDILASLGRNSTSPVTSASQLSYSSFIGPTEGNFTLRVKVGNTGELNVWVNYRSEKICHNFFSL